MTTHKLIYGDSREVLKTISGVNLVITSPPYNVGMEYDAKKRLSRLDGSFEQYVKPVSNTTIL